MVEKKRVPLRNFLRVKQGVFINMHSQTNTVISNESEM